MGAPSRTGTSIGRAAITGLAVALAVGGFLRLWDLTGQSLYLDEAFTLDAARMPLDAMFRYLAAHDAHPPLFYLYAHAALARSAWQPASYRYLTAPFGLLTIACTWALARRAFGDVGAFAAAIVVATEPTLVLFDRLFRMYSIATALGAVSFCLLFAALPARGRKRVWLWIAYALVACALPAVLYLGALLLVCQAAYALRDLRQRWPVVAACAAAPLAQAPWWWGIREQLPQAGYAGGQAGSSWHVARDVLGYAFPVGWYHGGTTFDVAFTVAVSAVLIAGAALARGGVVGLYAAPLALQAIATGLFGRNLLYGRYLIYLIPGFALSCGFVTAALMRSKVRVAGLVVLCAILAVNGIADTNLLLDKFYQMSDWNKVESLMEADERPSDAIVFDQGYAYFVLRSSPAVTGHQARGPQDPAAIPATVRWIDGMADVRVWYVENQRFYSDPQGDVKRHLEATRPRLREWLEVKADPSNIVYLALYGPMKPQAERANRP